MESRLNWNDEGGGKNASTPASKKKPDNVRVPSKKGGILKGRAEEGEVKGLETWGNR